MLRKLTAKERRVIKDSFTKDVETKLRKLWGVSLVSHYKNSTKVISPERAISIESLTGIPAEALRPDIFKGRR